MAIEELAGKDGSLAWVRGDKSSPVSFFEEGSEK